MLTAVSPPSPLAGFGASPAFPQRSARPPMGPPALPRSLACPADAAPLAGLAPGPLEKNKVLRVKLSSWPCGFTSSRDDPHSGSSHEGSLASKRDGSAGSWSPHGQPSALRMSLKDALPCPSGLPAGMNSGDFQENTPVTGLVPSHPLSPIPSETGSEFSCLQPIPCARVSFWGIPASERPVGVSDGACPPHAEL